MLTWAVQVFRSVSSSEKQQPWSTRACMYNYTHA